MTLQKNVGGADRIIRIVLGLVILAAGYANGSLWGLLGLVLLATAIFRWCPVYIPFGISTKKAKLKSG